MYTFLQKMFTFICKQIVTEINDIYWEINITNNYIDIAVYNTANIQ